MQIGGFQKTSLIDYPGHLSAIIWTPGCNFRCPFCYNRDLVFGDVPLISEQEVFSHLKKRQGVLDAISITGGEPLLQKDIQQFIEKVKTMGYLVKLDTNGTQPKALKSLLDKNLLDYVAMDIKASKKKYDQLAGVKVDLGEIEDSIALIKKEAPAYEFRTTIVPGLLTEKDILVIGKWLKGAKKYVLQQFERPHELIDSGLKPEKAYSRDFFNKVQEKIKKDFDKVEIRGVD